MITFLVHTSNGRILAVGTTIDEAAALSNISGTSNSVILNVPPGTQPTKHYISEEGEVTEISAQPTATHTFDYDTKTWVDPRSLAGVKDSQKALINTWRATANQTSFTYSGKNIACDQLSRSDIDAVNGEISLTGSFPAGWPGGWKAIDNTYVVISDVPTWTAFYQAMTAQGTANFAHAQSLKAAVEAANSIAEVEAIVW